MNTKLPGSLSRRALITFAGAVTAALPQLRARSAQANSHAIAEIVQPDHVAPEAFIERAFELRRQAVDSGDQAYGAAVVKEGRSSASRKAWWCSKTTRALTLRCQRSGMPRAASVVTGCVALPSIPRHGPARCARRRRSGPASRGSISAAASRPAARRACAGEAHPPLAASSEMPWSPLPRNSL